MIVVILPCMLSLTKVLIFYQIDKLYSMLASTLLTACVLLPSNPLYCKRSPSRRCVPVASHLPSSSLLQLFPGSLVPFVMVVDRQISGRPKAGGSCDLAATAGGSMV